MNLIKITLSHLLHHANKQPDFWVNRKTFYRKKKEILNRWGKVVGYDFQKIEGKKCYSCNGTGVHEKISYYTGEVYDLDSCWHCAGGWFKLPQFNILARIEMNGFIFHQPIKRFHSEKTFNEYVKESNIEFTKIEIEGYVNHNKPNYFKRDLFYILFFPKIYFKKFWKSLGRGYYYNWWKPYNFLSNTVGYIKKKWIRDQTKEQVRKYFFYDFQLPHNFNPKITSKAPFHIYDDSDMPF